MLTLPPSCLFPEPLKKSLFAGIWGVGVKTQTYPSHLNSVYLRVASHQIGLSALLLFQKGEPKLLYLTHIHELNLYPCASPHSTCTLPLYFTLHPCIIAHTSISHPVPYSPHPCTSFTLPHIFIPCSTPHVSQYSLLHFTLHLTTYSHISPH